LAAKLTCRLLLEKFSVNTCISDPKSWYNDSVFQLHGRCLFWRVSVLSMKRFRYPLIAWAVLAAYLVMSVPIRGMHRHGGQPGPIPSPADQLPGATDHHPSVQDGDDDHACAICKVLHLAQSAETTVLALQARGATAETLYAKPVHRPRSLERIAHSRAPPAV
jgi:hypothetical protein